MSTSRNTGERRSTFFLQPCWKFWTRTWSSGTNQVYEHVMSMHTYNCIVETNPTPPPNLLELTLPLSTPSYSTTPFACVPGGAKFGRVARVQCGGVLQNTCSDEVQAPASRCCGYPAALATLEFWQVGVKEIRHDWGFFWVRPRSVSHRSAGFRRTNAFTQLSFSFREGFFYRANCRHNFDASGLLQICFHDWSIISFGGFAFLLASDAIINSLLGPGFR